MAGRAARASLVPISAHALFALAESRERGARGVAERLATLDGTELAALTAALPVLERVVGDRS
ncbi:MAG: hypothetical protein WKF60_10055 [Ilumatobacter sp.]